MIDEVAVTLALGKMRALRQARVCAQLARDHRAAREILDVLTERAYGFMPGYAIPFHEFVDYGEGTMGTVADMDPHMLNEDEASAALGINSLTGIVENKDVKRTKTCARCCGDKTPDVGLCFECASK